MTAVRYGGQAVILHFISQYFWNDRRRSALSMMQKKDLTRFGRAMKRYMEMEAGRSEAEAFQREVNRLRSIHLEPIEPVDWNELLHAAPPFPKDAKGPRQREAEAQLTRYRPGLFDRWFGREKWKRERLTARIAEAAEEDRQAYRAWEEQVALAQAMVNRDPARYVEGIERSGRFEKLAPFCSGFQFKPTADPERIEGEFHVHPAQVVPKQMKTLTKSGKLSVKEMPKTQYYALEQDFVCSCVIRVALELFALLPVGTVYLHALDERMNPSTGFREPAVLLSAKLERRVLYSLNWHAMDCSEAMVNFEHRMKFWKTRGFEPVERLKPPAPQAAAGE
jgi:hypothetical protein